MKNNKTCMYKYKIGNTIYCDICHDGYTPCTGVPSRCDGAVLIDARKTPQRYYSFKDKRVIEKNNDLI